MLAAALVVDVLGAVASLVASVASLVVAVGMLRTRRAVAAVHSEVKTANGITLAVLADRAEGRRIEADVPTADRTESEQGYVDELNQPLDGEGNPPAAPGA